MLQVPIHYQDPPAHEYVLEVTVPMPASFSGELVVPGRPTDSRLVLSLPDHKVYEVCVLMPAGQGEATVVPGRDSGPNLVGRWLQYLVNPSLLVLRIDGTDFPLTDRANFVQWYRFGKVVATARFHLALGDYGWAEYWISVRADSPQLDVALLWHAAIPGPNRVFGSAEILSTAPWEPSLPDPACAPPYLVRPGRHVIPKQMARPFWFTVGAHEKEHVGISDWSGGGFLPSEFPVPVMAGISFKEKRDDARLRLSQLLPSEDLAGESESFLWPASGYRTMNAGGGNDRAPLAGALWAASRGDAAAHESYRIEQLRNLCRARIRLGPDGGPLELDGLSGDWVFFDGFLAGQDAPWEWDSYPEPLGDYDPTTFVDHDSSTLMRRLNENWALVWLANDPIARLITLEGATRARLTFWEGPGRARRLAIPEPEGMGSNIGSSEANAALAISAARALGATEYEPWIDTFLGHLRRAQMPSGCFTARGPTAYPSPLPPFNNQYMLQGGSEFAYLQLAAYGLGAHDLVRKAARGMVALATDDDDPGFYYYTATGQGDVRFLSEDDWPDSLHEQMGLPNESYYTAWDMGYAVALALRVGAPEAPELLRRYVGHTPRASMRSWGLVAPDSQTRAPFDQWWALLGVLEHP